MIFRHLSKNLPRFVLVQVHLFIYISEKREPFTKKRAKFFYQNIMSINGNVLLKQPFVE